MRIFLPLLILCVACAGASAQVQNLSAERISDCCFSFTYTNNNAEQRSVTMLSLKSTGSRDSLPPPVTAPASWSGSIVQGKLAVFSTITDAIVHGDSRTGFRVCVLTPGNTITIAWAAEDSSGVVSTGEVLLACRDACDSAAILRNSGCCVDWNVHNQNVRGLAINAVRARILTPSVSWGTSTIAPPEWLVVRAGSDRLDFTTGSAPIPANGSLGTFGSCMSAAGSPGSVLVEVATFLDSIALCRDTLSLRCDPTPQRDTLETDTAGSLCCYRVTVKNRNVAQRTVDGLGFRILSTDATFTGTPAGPWQVRTFTAKEIFFGNPVAGISPGEQLNGFFICLDRTPGSTGPVTVLWTTYIHGVVISEDTTRFECSIPLVRCDSVRLDPSTGVPPPNACCYALRLYNLHQPSGPTNGLRLRLLTAGAAFEGSPTGPWPVRSSTPTEVVYGTVAGLDSGRNTGEFNFCVKVPQGFLDTLRIEWASIFNTVEMCAETTLLVCAPLRIETNDTVTVRPVSDCTYDFDVINRHVPSTPLDAVQFRMVVPGSAIESAIAPAGWNIESFSAQAVVFKGSGSLASGDTLRGVRLTVSPPPGGGPMTLAWCTAIQQVPLSCDSLVLQCIPVVTRCDTVIVRALPEQCGYSFTATNRHEPASIVDRLRFSVTTPSAGVSFARPPSGWIVEQATGNTVIFRDTTGGLAPGASKDGFEIVFQPAAGNPLILMQICSMRGDTLRCCVSASVRCEDQPERCDSLSIVPAPGECSFDVGFTNTHSPASIINGFRVHLPDAGATIITATAPSGWSVTGALPQEEILFHAPSGGVPFGSSIAGFLISINPPAGSGTVRLEWCTLSNGRQECCDSTLVQCRSTLPACDSVAIVPEAQRACCFDLSVTNGHVPQGVVSGLRIETATPGVSIFASTIEQPAGWNRSATDTRVLWFTSTDAVAPGATRDGFRVCFDNNSIGNGDFLLAWLTLQDVLGVCSDTVRMICDRTLDADGGASVPDRFALHPNYPNPFRAITTAVFDVPGDADVEITVFDAAGRRVLAPVQGRFRRGTHAIRIDLSVHPGGAYFLRMRSGDFNAVRPMLIMR